MPNKDAQTCWDYWQCSKEDRLRCTAYLTNSGKECWLVAGLGTTRTRRCPKLQNEFKQCSECPWYILMNPAKRIRSRIDNYFS